MPSTVVAHMKYDSVKQILRITFVSGLIYDYLHVPEYVYNRMKAAKSKGIFLNRHIKGKYNFEKV
ncbi:KTSC domain-containing protein [Chitinophaga sp. CF118]|uniref:KTSC domain-containing protein n=1 Tax=Chitinophaga sp. CF118 TaxID=1884367 RepID=UPI0008E5ECD0|nr:KTSC domain-containing protein [Chitinophaga sp. CF118]SFE84693.1 KTSC domain-containing protein [Chitinophaga sp. CF118]